MTLLVCINSPTLCLSQRRPLRCGVHHLTKKVWSVVDGNNICRAIWIQIVAMRAVTILKSNCEDAEVHLPARVTQLLPTCAVDSDHRAWTKECFVLVVVVGKILPLFAISEVA